MRRPTLQLLLILLQLRLIAFDILLEYRTEIQAVIILAWACLLITSCGALEATCSVRRAGARLWGFLVSPFVLLGPLGWFSVRRKRRSCSHTQAPRSCILQSLSQC